MMKPKEIQQEPIEVVEESKVRPVLEIFMGWLFEHYDFRVNELSQKEEFKPIDEEQFTEIDERSFNSISLQASRAGFKDNLINKIRTIIKSDQTPLVNEIKDYFEALNKRTSVAVAKDGTITAPTIRKFFDMMTLRDEQQKDKEMYFNIFVRYMIASVNSGLKIKHNDVMLMLSGPQGIFKTSYLDFLTPKTLGKEKYLLTGHIIPELTNSNTANALCERFFINIDDQMEVIFGQAYNSMKAIISANQITSRRAYARFDKTRRRIANFVGAVNGAEFLTDSTNRRYFVIDIEKISPKYNTVDMDKFWQEAYLLSKKIKPFDIYGKEVFKQIIAIADNFVEESLEMILINEYFKAEPNDTYNTKVFMTTGEILRELQKYQQRSIYLYKISNELKRSDFIYKSTRQKRFVSPKYGYVLYVKSKDADDLFYKYIY